VPQPNTLPRAPSSVKSFGKNFAGTRCIPKSSIKIMWHELMDIPVSSATSRTVSRRFTQMMFFTWAIRISDPEVEDQPYRSSSFVEVLPFLKSLNLQ
jgi:hypothetical protein